jgi:type IV pilus assembly protein PilA
MSLPLSPRKQSGFTLIELMVVMAIIAILATVGLSAYTGYIAKARDTARAPLARTTELAVISFMSSHNGIAPNGAELEAELTAMGVSWVITPSLNPGVALVSNTLGTLDTLGGLLGFTTYALPVKDPA